MYVLLIATTATQHADNQRIEENTSDVCASMSTTPWSRRKDLAMVLDKTPLR
jgi:hypothetical protein